MRRFLLPLLFSCCFALAVFEGFLHLFWPQENMYLYSLRDDMIFNRPGFSDFTAMRPYVSLSQLRRFLNVPDPLFAKDAPLLKPFIEINNQGFRQGADSISLEKSKPIRIVNLGGSIGFGWPEPLENGYLKLLEKLNPNVETLNCSIIAANSPQLLKIYDKICSAYQHDWVLIQVTTSPNVGVPDFLSMDFWGGEYRIHQSLWWTQRTALLSPSSLAGRPLSDLIPPIDWKDPETRNKIQTAYSPHLPFYEQLHLVRLIENIFILTPQRGGSAPVIEEVLNIQHQPWFLLKVKELLDNGQHPTLASIEKITALAHKKNARTLVMILPNHFDAASGNAFRRQDIQWLMKALDRKKISYIRPTEWFKNEEIPIFYRPQDEHPTIFGYQRMAEVISAKLEKLSSADR